MSLTSCSSSSAVFLCVLSLVQGKLTGLAQSHMADSAHEGLFPSVQVAVLCATLLAGEALATYITAEASDAQMSGFYVPFEVEFGVICLPAVLGRTAVGHHHEIFHWK